MMPDNPCEVCVIRMLYARAFDMHWLGRDDCPVECEEKEDDRATTINVICDMCGRECDRWFEVSAFPKAKHSWQNIADMLPDNGLICWTGQLCKACFKKAFITKEADDV